MFEKLYMSLLRIKQKLALEFCVWNVRQGTEDWVYQGTVTFSLHHCSEWKCLSLPVLFKIPISKNNTKPTIWIHDIPKTTGLVMVVPLIIWKIDLWTWSILLLHSHLPELNYSSRVLLTFSFALIQPKFIKGTQVSSHIKTRHTVVCMNWLAVESTKLWCGGRLSIQLDFGRSLRPISETPYVHLTKQNGQKIWLLGKPGTTTEYIKE